MTDTIIGKAGALKESILGKTEEVKGKASETAQQAKDRSYDTTGAAKEKTGAAQDTALGKAEEYKNVAVDTLYQAKDTLLGKIEEYKGSAADASARSKETAQQTAQQAKETAGAKKEESKGYLQSLKETWLWKGEEAKEKGKEATDDAQKRHLQQQKEECRGELSSSIQHHSALSSLSLSLSRSKHERLPPCCRGCSQLQALKHSRDAHLLQLFERGSRHELFLLPRER